jgi:HTH-type transcriptional regulator, sugar sensing transcriptional regulator
MQKTLEEIGLTKGEIKVYLTLMKIGETTTGKIIEKSGLSGGKIYVILDKLIKKGLVVYTIKEKTKYFQTTTPKKLLEYVEEKKKNIEKKKQEIESLLPQLLKLHLAKEEDYSAVIYKGKQGLKTVLYDTLDTLSKGDEWLAFGVRGDRPKDIVRIWNHWLNARIKKKVPSKMIVANKEGFEAFKHLKLTEFKMLKLEAFAPITISGDTVIIYNWKELSVIKIKNKDIANSFKELFYSLWGIGKK